MADIDLNFLSRQLATIISELRSMRDEVRNLRSLRDEIGLLREEVRVTTTAIRRLEDTITMSVLDRLQALEAAVTRETP